MTILQRLLLEAGTAAIVVLTAYALLPVLLILINGDMTAARKTPSSPDRGARGKEEEE